LKLANQYLLEYKGETFSEKLKNKIHNHILEERIKKISSLLPMALVCVQDNKEIKSLGVSIPNDLLTDNYGKTLAGMFRPVAVGNNFFTINDLSNNLETMRYYANSPSGFNNAGARSIQIGSGNTPPTRQDFNIETPFSNGGQEDNAVAFSNAGFDGAGTTKESITLTTTGAGVIAETINRWNGRNSAGASRTWILTRDLISPTSSFIASQQVFVEYNWQT